MNVAESAKTHAAWLPLLRKGKWENWGGSEGAANTTRSLTRSSDSTREGLIVQPTYHPWIKFPNLTLPGSGPLTDRELRRLAKSLPEVGSNCGEWLGRDRHVYGYGFFSLYRSGKRRTHRFSTHRLIYALHYGCWPDDLVVRHRCDNPPCVNPAHLLLGTQADNVQDAVSRHRVNVAGLSAATLKICTACGSEFAGRPGRQYCNEHVPKRNEARDRRAAARPSVICGAPCAYGGGTQPAGIKRDPKHGFCQRRAYDGETRCFRHRAAS